MGDETVEIVAKALEEIAWANGIERSKVRPIADTVVNHLRGALTDRMIEALFEEAINAE